MRSLALFLPLLLIAAPAAAQERAIEIPPELTDPKMAETLGRMSGALAKAMLDMPVGEMMAAVEGREPTPADRIRTVRDVAGANDPHFERRIEQQVAQGSVVMQRSMKALAASMPSIMASLEKMGEELERELDRASANMPQPGYPNR